MDSITETSYYKLRAGFSSEGRRPAVSRCFGLPYDMTTFIATALHHQVDILNLSWLPGLEELGRGGSAEIRQSIINLKTSFAFKRITFPDSEEEDEALIVYSAITELLILSHPALRAHRNIIGLEGICWDPSTELRPIRPVLVLERSGFGDLGRFMSKHADDLSPEDRIELCADIINAVYCLHQNGIIHGDVKPENFLVFREEGCEPPYYYAKLTDFNFSTLVNKELEDAKVDVPISWPWSAPELDENQHDLSIAEAKATDIYSVGLLCLWLLFGESQRVSPENPWNGTYDWISKLRDTDALTSFVQSGLNGLADVEDEMKSNLVIFFRLTTASKRESRIPELAKFVLSTPMPLEDNPFVSSLPLFSIREAFGDLMLADFSFRTHIIDCLRLQCLNDLGHQYRSNAAFQLAVCYTIGFGALEDDDVMVQWLNSANRSLEELRVEKETIRRRENMQNLSYHSPQLNMLAHGGFLSNQSSIFWSRCDEDATGCSRELEIMQRTLLPTDPVLLDLQSLTTTHLKIRGHYQQARLAVSETLQFYENDSKYGPEHSRTLYTAIEKVELLRREGQFDNALELGQHTLQTCEKVNDKDNLLTATIQKGFAKVLSEKELYGPAETLIRQAVQTFDTLLGSNHPSAVGIKNDLGALLITMGRYEEGSNIMLEVIGGHTKTLLKEHAWTLNAIGNTAACFDDLGLYEAAETCYRSQLVGEVRLEGANHPQHATTLSNLAIVLKNQNRYEEAESVAREALIESQKLFGDEYHGTLICRNNLANILSRLERYEEAVDMLQQVISAFEKQLGTHHTNTINTKINLAQVLRRQGQLDKAKSLLVDVLVAGEESTGGDVSKMFRTQLHLGMTLGDLGETEASAQELRASLNGQKSLWGEQHPSVLATMSSLAKVLDAKGEWEEARRLHLCAVKGSEIVLGHLHTQTLASMYWLARHRIIHNQYGEADDLLQQAYAGYKTVLGEDHSHTRNVLDLSQQYKGLIEDYAEGDSELSNTI